MDVEHATFHEMNTRNDASGNYMRWMWNMRHHNAMDVKHATFHENEHTQQRFMQTYAMDVEHATP